MDGSSTNVSLNLQTTMIAMFDAIINNRLALKVITDLTTNPTELIKSSLNGIIRLIERLQFKSGLIVSMRQVVP